MWMVHLKAGILLQECQRSKTVDFRYAEHSVVLPDLHTTVVEQMDGPHM